MSQNPDKPHSREEEKLSGLEDSQEESLDNPDQSIRKRIRQSAPGSPRDDTPKCKQKAFFEKKKVVNSAFCLGRENPVFFIVLRADLTALQLGIMGLLIARFAAKVFLPT